MALFTRVKFVSYWFFVCFFSLFSFYTQAASTPTVNNTSPAENFIGEQFCFTTEFSNTSTDIGYGPYYQLILNPDLNFASSSFSGLPVTTVSNEVFPASGTLTDPISGQPVTGVADGSLVILTVPVGSVSSTQAALPVEICLNVDNAAVPDVLQPNAITLVPGFQFGDSATGTIGTDTILGSPSSNDFTPKIITYDVNTTVAESENPPGPAWTYPITAVANIASDRTVTPIQFPPITLPGNVKYVGPMNITGGTNCTFTPSEADLLALSGIGNDVTIDVRCDSGTGTIGNQQDIRVDFNVYITDTLNSTTCATTGALNTAKHLVLRKSASGTGIPGSTITYTYSYQTSEFISALNQFLVSDVLEDGMSFVDAGGNQVALTINQSGSSATVNVPFSVSGNNMVFNNADILTAIGTVGAAQSGTISYQATIDQFYRSGGAVLTRDTINNSVTATYGISGAGNAQNCTEGSQASVTIEDVSIKKTVVGNATALPGEVLHFQLEMKIPSGDANSVKMIDVLPKPVFLATDFPAFTGNLNSYPNDPVTGNHIRYAAGSYQPASVTVTPIASSNSLEIDFGNIAEGVGETLIIDVYAKATDDAYADNLSLANLLNASTNNSLLDQAAENTATQILVRAPDVLITKEIVTPTTAPDAGDAIEYRITLENQGGADAFDVVVTDILDTHLDPTSCTVPVISGGSGGFTGTLTTGLKLNNSLGANNAALGRAASGNQTATLTFSCNLKNTVPVDTVVTNKAEVVFAAGINGTPFPKREAEVDITTRIPSVVKSLVATSEAYTIASGGREGLVVGELARFRIAVEIPEGTQANARIEDLLPNRLTYKNDGTAKIAFVTDNPNTITASAYTAPTGCTLFATTQSVTPDCTIAATGSTFNIGDNPVFNLGTLGNSESDANSEYLIIEFNAYKGDSTESAINFANQGRFRANSKNYHSNNVNLKRLDPALTIAKSANKTEGDAGEAITYTLLISAPASSPATAFDVKVSDVLPADLAYQASSAAFSGCPATATTTFNDTNPNTTGFALTISELKAGESCSFSYDVMINASAVPNESIKNEANLSWTSLQSGGSNLAGSTPGAAKTYTAKDDATVHVQAVAATKSIVSTNFSHTAETGTGAAGSPRLLSIGETIKYRLVANVPESTANNFIIRDALPDGMAYIANTAFVGLVSNGGLTSSLGGSLCTGGTLNHTNPVSGVTPNCAITPTLGTVGNSVDFNFGNIVNSDRDADLESIVIEFEAQVQNQLVNQQGAPRNNTFSALVGGTTNSTSNIVQALVVEPQLTLTSTVTPATVDNRTNTTPTFSWRLVLTNSGLAQAFQIQDGDSGNWQVQLPTGVENITNVTVASTGGVVQNSDLTTAIAAGNFSVGGADNNVLSINAPFAMPAGATLTINFDAKLKSSVTPGSTLTSKTDLDYASQQVGTSADNVRTFADISTGTGNNPIAGTSAPLNNYRVEQNLVVNTTASNPSIGLAKELISNQFNAVDNSFDVGYRFHIENTGDVDLTQVQVSDDLAATFNPVTDFTLKTISSPTLPVNTGFTGKGNNNLVDTGSPANLAVGATATIDVTINIKPGTNLGTYNNNATASAKSARNSSKNVSDQSVNGDDPDPADDGAGNDTSPTPVTLAVNPKIGIAKAVHGAIKDNKNGTFTFTYRFVVKNLGDVNLNGVQITENLTTSFPAPASVSGIVLSSSDLTVNSSFNGSSDVNILAPSQDLNVNDVATVDLTLTVDPAANLGPYNNQVTASAVSPAGTVPDQSDSGTNPETDNGQGGFDDPTTIEFRNIPEIGVAKAISQQPINNGDGTYTLGYSIVVENTGGIALSNVQVQENLATTFPNPAAFSVQGVSATRLTVNSGFNGASNTDLLASGQSLAIGESESITLTIQVTPSSNLGPYNNQVTASGENPSGVKVTDISDNGSSATGNNGSGGENDPTPVTFVENPQVGVAKALVSTPVSNDDGTHTVSYRLVVKNSGDVDLANVQLIEDLAATFPAPATVQVTSVDAGTLTTNAQFNGQSDTNLLAANQSLAVGASDTLTLNLIVTPKGNLGPYENQVTAQGNSPSGAQVSDLSDDGTNPEGDNGAGTENDPTPVTFTEAPQIGVAKALVSEPTNNGDGTYSLSYRLVVANTGDIALANVQLIEDLAATFPAPATVQVTSVDAGTLTTNPQFNGQSDTNLLAANQSLAVGESDTLTLNLIVTPKGNLGPYENQVTAQGNSPSGAQVSDLSDNGTDPTGDNGAGGEEDTTPVTFSENPRIGIAKTVSGDIEPTPNKAGLFNVPFSLVIQNIGDVPLTQIQVVDDLQAQLGDIYDHISVAPVITASDAAQNPVISADFPANLFDGNSGRLLPQQSLTVTFSVAMNPAKNVDNKKLTNQAQAQGLSSGLKLVSDLSDSGTNPTDDPATGGDNQGQPGDTGGVNDPTPFELPKGALQGTVWLDVNTNDNLDTDETLLIGWLVKVYDAQGNLVAEVLTDANGFFSVENLPTGDYRVEVVTPTGTTFMQQQVNLPANAVVDVPVPVDPSGVVYDSITRAVVPNSLVQLLDEQGNLVPEQCLLPGQQNQVTGADGFYFFLVLLDADPACPSNGNLQLAVTGPAEDYQAGHSQLILPQQGSLDPTGLGNPYSVGSSANAPQVGENTTYYMAFTLATGDPDVVNNHIPIDQIGVSENMIRLTKRAEQDIVMIGDLVRYRISVENLSKIDLTGLTLVDTLPAGFTYVAQSAQVKDSDNQLVVSSNSPLTLEGIDVPAESSVELVYILRVGAGVARGKHVNRVSPYLFGRTIGNEATATVTVGADPDFEKITILGKVFDDQDGDNWQDSATATGIYAQGGIEPSSYIANSSSLIIGATQTPLADASAPLNHGIDIGTLTGRSSEADKPVNHQVIIRQKVSALSFTDFTLSTAEGTKLTMNAKGEVRYHNQGQVANSRNGQQLVVTRHVALLGDNNYQVDYVIQNHGIQEIGIPGVRIATVEGIYVETDVYGRFHLADVDVPNLARGQNFYMKVDKATLPPNTEFVSENPRVKRVTQGLPARFDFAVKLAPVKLGGETERVEMNVGSVLFAANSSEISSQYSGLIEQMAQKVNQYQGGRLYIRATADNQQLAYQRAASLQQALLVHVRQDLQDKLEIVLVEQIDESLKPIVSLSEQVHLGQVFFDNDKTVIKPQYVPLLRTIAEQINKAESGKLSIIGYADSSASEAYNLKLGLNRAKQVLKFLQQHLPKDKVTGLSINVITAADQQGDK